MTPQPLRDAACPHLRGGTLVPFAASLVRSVRCASRNRPPAGFLGRFLSVLGALALGLGLLSGSAYAQHDPRTLGYVVATDYSGVDPTGVGDSTLGLNAAIEAASQQDKVLFIPLGTYTVSGMLHFYGYLNPFGTDNYTTYRATTGSVPHIGIMGETTPGGQRPLIRLQDGLAQFQNPAEPQAVLAIRVFGTSSAQSGTAAALHNRDESIAPQPAHALAIPAGYSAEQAMNHFLNFVRDLEIDCGTGNPGAIGLRFPAGEGSYIANVKVNARDGLAAFYGLPGRGETTLNIEAVGGQYGVRIDGTPGGGASAAGAVVAGARFSGQGIAAVHSDDFVPLTVVGFEASLPVGTTMIRTTTPAASTCSGTMTFLDGKVAMDPTVDLAFDNGIGKNLYLRNVYVSGTDQVVQSGAQPIVSRGGAWKWIREYVYTDQNKRPDDDPPYEVKDDDFTSYSVINGVVDDATAEPATDIQADSAVPPVDLATRHYWAGGPYAGLPQYAGNPANSGAAMVVTDAAYGAIPNDGLDDRAAIQAAIAAASAAGHGRVFLPKGTYHLSGTLNLHANTILFGLSHDLTTLDPADSWRNSVSSPQFMLTTANDADAATFAGSIRFIIPNNGTGGQPSPVDWFGLIDWQAGRNSMTFHLYPYLETYYSSSSLVPTANPHPQRWFHGNGGGRHYSAGPLMHASIKNHDVEGCSLYLVQDTTQPLWFYGFKETVNTPPYYVRLQNASNVRLYELSFENAQTALRLEDVHNVAFYSYGRDRVIEGLPFLDITGASDGILGATLTAQSITAGGAPTVAFLHEQITGQSEVSLVWPNCISLYKRGTIDDGAMVHDYMTAGPTVTVTATDASAAEQGSEPGAFTLMRDGSTGAPLTVNYTLGGTATNGADYASPGGSVTFAAGSATATVTVTPVTDTAVEGDETVVLSLAPGIGYIAGSPDSATVTIADRDMIEPEINTLTADPDHLWPANHKMVAVTLAVTASDDHDPAPVSRILSVSSTEPDDAPGTGGTTPDWEITGDLTVNLRAERAGTGTGRIYIVTVQCTDAAGNSTTASVLVPVAHNNDTQAPAVTLTAPAASALVGGAAVHVSATATDNDGVTGVQFQLDGANLGLEAVTPPYAISWNTTATTSGNHTLTAVARDDVGNTTISAGVTVMVDNVPPTVALTTPAAGALLSGAGVPVAATATDNVAVAGVQFKLDGTALGAEDTTAPHETTFDSATVADGPHTLTATARDSIGNTATSAPVSVLVDNLPPTVALTAPGAGATVGGASVALSATATDIVGVAGVQFQIDGVNLGTEDTAAPYALTWDTTTVGDGAHVLTAVARDLAGHTAVSAPVTVTVDNTAPTVALTAPAAGATVSGASVALAATASDGTAVAGVQFQLDGVNLGAEDTAAPYGVTWNTTAASSGSHTLTAVARDSVGNVATSTAVVVTVNNAPVGVAATFQAETTPVAASSGDAISVFPEVNPVRRNYAANAVGDYITFKASGVAAGVYKVSVRLQRAPGGGIFQLESSPTLNGVYTPIGGPNDAYNPTFSNFIYTTTNVSLTAGDCYFRFRIVGKNAASTGYALLIDYIQITP